jgi:hypothetical protein
MRATRRNGRKDSICDRMANVASVKMTAQRKRGSGRVRSKVAAGREKTLIAGNQRWDACCLLALALAVQAPLIVEWLDWVSVARSRCGGARAGVGSVESVGTRE